MSSQQHRRTNQEQKKSSETRITDDYGMKRQAIERNIGPSSLGLRAKRRRLGTNRVDKGTDSLDSLLVVYDRNAKEVVEVKEDIANISDSYKIKSQHESNSSHKKKSNSNNTNNNKRVSCNRSTNPNQTSYYDDNNTVNVDCVITESNSSYNNVTNNQSEISSRRVGEKKKSGCFQLKSSTSMVKGLSTIIKASSSSSNSSKKKKKNQQKQERGRYHHHSQIASSTIKSLKKKLSSGQVQPTTQRPKPRQTTHKERKWNNKWKLDFPWLERGVNMNGREVGMCLWCQSCGKKNSFANDGSTNLQYSAFQRHQTNREHRESALEKQILEEQTNNTTADCSEDFNFETGPVPTECVSTAAAAAANKQTQLKILKVLKHEDLSSSSSSTPIYFNNQTCPVTLSSPSMVQPVYPSPPYHHHHQQQHYDDNIDTIQPSGDVTSFYNDGDNQNTSTSSQRVFLLSKKDPPIQLSGDLLILQEGLESWTTSSGISSLIESLEGCSAATTTTSTASSRAIVSEELPSFSSTSVKSPTPFKKAYVESEHADGILKSLSWLWRTNKLCDAVICSGETKIMLHRLILFAVSPHLLEKNIRDGAELEVNLPSGINDEALATFVAFLYDGVLNLTEYNYKDIERVGNLLKVEKVQRYCREFANSLAEYKLHQQLPMPLAPVMDGGNHEYVGKRKRGRPSKQTVVLNLGDDHNLGDRLDPSHYLQSGELSNYHSMALSGATMSRMNSDMPVVFPDSQEYCLPSTSQTSQLFPSNQGHVKTEPYQQSAEFCSPFHMNPKGSKSNNSKEDADNISSFVSHETSGKSSTTMDIQTSTTSTITTTNNNNNNDGEEDNNSTRANNNNNDNSKNSTSSATTEKNSTSKSSAKSLSSPSSKGDGSSSETVQSSSYAASVIATSGDGFSLYSLASS